MMTAPTNVTFTSGTTITSEWLNGVNDYVNELDPADHSSANVTYDPPFTNSVATTVEDKLAQYISVKDFGAVGDGVTNDTTAIQNAINTGKNVFVPKGTYLVSGTLTISSSGQGFFGEGFNSQLILSNATTGISISGGIEDIQIKNLKLYSAQTSNTLISITGVSTMGVISNIYFSGGGTQIKLTSGVSSSGSYGFHISECVFYAAAVKALSIAPQSTSYSQSHFISNCEFFGNVQSLFITSANGVFVNQCRFERMSTLSGAIAAIHIDTSHKVVIRDCYLEDNNAVTVIELGSGLDGVVIDGNYFTLNSNAATLNVIAIKCTSTNDNLSVTNNYILALGTTTTILDFGATTNLQCVNNTLNVSTTTSGILSSCDSQVANISQNVFIGTFTTKTDQRVQALQAKAWALYNGSTQTLVNDVNIGSVTRNAAGDYTFTFTTAMPNVNYVVVATSSAATNGTLYCFPTVYSKTTSAFTIRMFPSGAGTGNYADSNALHVVVFGDKFN